MKLELNNIGATDDIRVGDIFRVGEGFGTDYDLTVIESENIPGVLSLRVLHDGYYKNRQFNPKGNNCVIDIINEMRDNVISVTRSPHSVKKEFHREPLSIDKIRLGDY